jgi:hypothetical protein
VSALPIPCDAGNVLLEVGGGAAPMPWPGAIRKASAAGPLCTQRPDLLTVWAPGAEWVRGFQLLAMFKSAPPEECLVLTDTLPPLDLVPSDSWVAVAGRGPRGPVQRGSAPFRCAELRSDRIFRLLLSGRVRRRPELLPLLRLHLLAGTDHGRCVLDRWEHVLPVMFAGGLAGMMPEELRADLEELAEAARDAEHAVTGGFHALDPVVRDPADWEAGAARYLPLAAAHSSEAMAVVRRWLDSAVGWEQAPRFCQETWRLTVARALHRLADDPWLSGRGVAELLFPGFGP